MMEDSESVPSTPTTTPTRDMRIGSPVCEPPPSADSLRFASNWTVAPCRFANSISDMTFCRSAEGTSKIFFLNDTVAIAVD